MRCELQLFTMLRVVFLCFLFLSQTSFGQNLGSIHTEQVDGMFVNWSPGGLKLVSGETVTCEVLSLFMKHSFASTELHPWQATFGSGSQIGMMPVIT